MGLEVAVHEAAAVEEEEEGLRGSLRLRLNHRRRDVEPGGEAGDGEVADGADRLLAPASRVWRRIGPGAVRDRQRLGSQRSPATRCSRSISWTSTASGCTVDAPPAVRPAARCSLGRQRHHRAQADGFEAVPRLGTRATYRSPIDDMTDGMTLDSLPRDAVSSHGEGVPEETLRRRAAVRARPRGARRGREVRRPLPRPRAVLAAVQPARPRARRGPRAAAAGADPLPGDLHQQPRRVLHGPGRRPQAPDRRRARRTRGVRADAAARCSS